MIEVKASSAHDYFNERMQAFVLLLFVSTCLARASLSRDRNHNVRQMPFQSPIEIKAIVLACDQDKDGELNSKEFEECVSTYNI